MKLIISIVEASQISLSGIDLVKDVLKSPRGGLSKVKILTHSQKRQYFWG